MLRVGKAVTSLVFPSIQNLTVLSLDEPVSDLLQSLLVLPVKCPPPSSARGATLDDSPAARLAR